MMFYFQVTSYYSVCSNVFLLSVAWYIYTLESRSACSIDYRSRRVIQYRLESLRGNDCFLVFSTVSIVSKRQRWIKKSRKRNWKFLFYFKKTDTNYYKSKLLRTEFFFCKSLSTIWAVKISQGLSYVFTKFCGGTEYTAQNSHVSFLC